MVILDFRGGYIASQTDNSRNDGIDLLRLVSMYMVILLHVLSTGGILSALPVLSGKYAAAWAMEMASYGAVNLFAITSGYVYYGKKTKYASLMQLTFQVLFCTVLSTAVCFVFFPDTVFKRTVLDALCPYRIEAYWYFTSYVCLFFFIPFINRLIDSLDRKYAARLLTVCFVVFSLLTAVLCHDIGGVNLGYSFLWLAVMYTVGACIKKFDFQITQRLCMLCYLIGVAASLAGMLGMEAVTLARKGEAQYGEWFSSYNAPLIVLSSVSLFLFFKNLHLSRTAKGIVRFFAPTAFGIYVIHLEPLIKNMILTEKYIFLAAQPAPLMIGGVLGAGLVIWLVCSLADRVRLEVFKLLRIHSLCQWIETKLRTAITGRFPFLAE